MSTARALPPVPSVPTIPFALGRLYRFTVEQYERMTEVGILGAKDRVELLEGWIIAKMTQNPPHNAGVDYTQEALRSLLPPEWRVREQKAIRLADSEPEPDVAVVKGPPNRYARRHPVPADIGALIEVADTSLLDDRRRKIPLYARARIPVYWIVNLPESRVEVYTQPKAGKSPTYQHRQDYGIDDSVPVVIDGKELGRIPVRDLLP
jgi:Uma2 family endonuclease